MDQGKEITRSELRRLLKSLRENQILETAIGEDYIYGEEGEEQKKRYSIRNEGFLSHKRVRSAIGKVLHAEGQ